MNDPRGPYVLTVTGVRWYPEDPRAEDVDPKDIAAGLANRCRFAGQLERFYSVAEHCVHVSHLVPDELALSALLHDAEEAYPPGDVPTPCKKLVAFAGVLGVQCRARRAIATRFGVLPESFDHPSIVEADRIMFAAETLAVRDVLPSDYWRTGRSPDAYDAARKVAPLHRDRIRFWAPPEAKRQWLRRLEELGR